MFTICRDLAEQLAQNMSMVPGTFTMHDLERESGVAARTLRHWIRQKVLPKPVGKGRGARYDTRHLQRARAAQVLRAARLSLRAIRTRIGNLSEQELLALAPPPRKTTPEGLPAPPPEPSYPAVTWEVVELIGGLVLLVNTTKGPAVRRIADDIYRHYGAPQAIRISVPREGADSL